MFPTFPLTPARPLLTTVATRPGVHVNLFFRPAEKTLFPTGRKNTSALGGLGACGRDWKLMHNGRGCFFSAGRKKTPSGRKNTSALSGLGPSPASRIATDLVFVSAHFRPRNAPKRYDFKGFGRFSVSQSRCTHLTTSEGSSGSQEYGINAS